MKEIKQGFNEIEAKVEMEKELTTEEKAKIENISLWNRVEKTNPEDTSEANFSGRKVTSIDAYTQIKKATEEFGPYGKGWGMKNTDLKLEKMTDDDTLCLYKAIFFYPGGEFEIHNSMIMKYKTGGKTGTGYVKIDNDFAKKVETNTITKALSRLGFNTDVFMGKFEDSMYLEEIKYEFAEEKLDELKEKLESSKSITELAKRFSALPIDAKAKLEVVKNLMKEKLTPKKNENPTVSK